MKIVHEDTEDGIVIPARSYVKDPSEFTDAEKEIASLDTSLQLILVEFLDPVMYNHIVNYQSAKHIWDTIEIINEGTWEVRENMLEILISQYEHFRSNPSEGIYEVFERYKKLINDLNLSGKYCTRKEIVISRIF